METIKLFVDNNITSFVRATKETTCEPSNKEGELICYYTLLFELNANWRLKVAVQNGFNRNQSNLFVADDCDDCEIKIFSCNKENKLMITATVIINNVEFPAKAEFIPLEQNELDDLIKNDNRVSLAEYDKANLHNPHLKSIYEHVRNIDPVIIKLKAENAAIQSTIDKIFKKGDHELITQAAAGIRRDNLLFSPGNMPDGPIGDALRALDPDERQIINLRLQLDDKGKRLSWPRIAKLFRRKGKGHKIYTDERCRQIYENAVEQQPDIEQYILGLSMRHKLNLSERPKTDEQADKEEIENTGNIQKFDMADLGDADGNNNAGFRVTKYPRKPI